MSTFVFKNLCRLFDSVAQTEHDALVKSTTKIFSTFVAFSENPNFNRIYVVWIFFVQNIRSQFCLFCNTHLKLIFKIVTCVPICDWCGFILFSNYRAYKNREKNIQVWDVWANKRRNKKETTRVKSVLGTCCFKVTGRDKKKQIFRAGMNKVPNSAYFKKIHAGDCNLKMFSNKDWFYNVIVIVLVCLTYLSLYSVVKL